MLILYLPSAGVKVEFRNGWQVTQATQGADGINFQPGRYPNEQLAKFITFFPSMWYVVKSMEKQCNDLLEEDAPAELPFELPIGLHWDLTGDHVPSTRPFGREFSYDDGASDWSLDSMLALFESLYTAMGGPAPSYLIGALHKKFRKRRFYYLCAAKTGHCVRYDLDRKAWEEYSGEPDGTATVSRVGVTSYISDGDKEPDESAIILGIDLLTRVVGVDYSTDLIADVPEDVFRSAPFGTPIEMALPMTTNRNRLFYFLNADYKLVTPKASKEVLVKKVAPPTVTWHPSADTGTPLALGGSFTLEGEAGTFELYDVVCWLNSQLDSYQDYADGFDASRIPKLAMDEFFAKFSQVRADVAPSHMDSRLPIQLVIDPVTYAWDGVRWFPMMGSQPRNPEEYNGFWYIHKSVDMALPEWSTLLQTCIDTFIPASNGLAALYYRTEEMPEEPDAFEGDMYITDPRTMQCAHIYNGALVGIYTTQQYSSEHIETNVGLLVECSGQGYVSSKTLAFAMCEAFGAAQQLLGVRYERRDALCAETAFGTYELLHQCMPAAMFSIHPQVNSGAMGDIDAPIVLYQGKQRISHTTRGWYSNNVTRDRAKKIGTVGVYQMAYEPGTMPWTNAIATLFKDVLELAIDYNSPAVVAALELEHAQ